MSVLEAMAAGLPVIATTVGGIPDLVNNGKEGILVPARNREKLQEAIEVLLRSQQLRDEMGRKGHERYKREFSAEIVIPLIEAVYRQLGVVPTKSQEHN